MKDNFWRKAFEKGKLLRSKTDLHKVNFTCLLWTQSLRVDSDICVSPEVNTKEFINVGGMIGMKWK